MTIAIPGRSFASPWPYTFRLNGVGVMGGTRTRQATEFTAQKPESQAQVQAPEFGYSADNPIFGAVTEYHQFRRGMGLKAQQAQHAGEDEQYDHALGVDASVYPIVKGPNLTLFTPAITDPVSGATRFMTVGSTLHLVVGRYALQRVSDTSWPVAQDFGAGAAATDAVAFYSNGLSAAYGFVAMGDAVPFWSTTGGVWTQQASLTALAWGVAAGELFRAHSTNTLSKVDTDADPTVPANWGNEYAFTVGDKASPVQRLTTTAAGVLLVNKTDGVYTIQGEGDIDPGFDRKLHDFLPDARNGLAVCRWGNDTYTGWTYNGFWRLSEDGSTREQVGPELLTDGSNVVAGQVTACEGTQFALYAGFYNPATGLSYLCKFLGMGERTGQKVPVWHGSLTQALPGKVTAMTVSTAGAPAGHARLYLGFSDGSLGWFTLPCTPHPADCPDYAFSTTDGLLTLPTWHGGFPANPKAIDSESVSALNLSTSTYVVVETRSSPTASFAQMAEPFISGQLQEVTFDTATAVTILDQRLRLVNTTTAASVRVTGLGLRHQLHTPFKQVFEIRVLAESGLRRRDGTPMALGRKAIKAVVETAADTPGGVTLVLPDEVVKNVRIRDVRQGVAWPSPLRGPARAYVLDCVEVSEVAVYGTYARLEAAGSYAALEALGSYAAMEAL